jgi:uncharacterized membrane protein YfcA
MFLAAVAFGAYVQAVTGFALGIFVLGAVVLLDISSIAITATALNFMTLATGSVVVLPRLRSVHWRLVMMTLVGLMPMMVVGVLALNYLSAHSQLMLRLLLGLLVMAGGFVLVWRPRPREKLSGRTSFISMGAVGGVLGGLFSVPAPPLVYQLYRQPLSVLTVRATLIALFSALGIGRLVVVGLEGDISEQVLQISAFSIPVVLVAAWLGNRFPPRISDTTMRRSVFALLMVAGGFITFTSMTGLAGVGVSGTSRTGEIQVARPTVSPVGL